MKRTVAGLILSVVAVTVFHLAWTWHLRWLPFMTAQSDLFHLEHVERHASLDPWKPEPVEDQPTRMVRKGVYETDFYTFDLVHEREGEDGHIYLPGVVATHAKVGPIVRATTIWVTGLIAICMLTTALAGHLLKGLRQRRAARPPPIGRSDGDDGHVSTES